MNSRENNFINKLNDIYNGNIIITSEYINMETSVECECKICGYKWNNTPSTLLHHKRGCPNCRKNERLKNRKNKIQHDINKINKDILVLEYIDNGHDGIVVCKCLADGYIWRKNTSKLLKNCTCPECNKKYKTKEDFVNELKTINNNIEIISDFKNISTKVLCKCLIDNNEWYALPYNLLLGKGCPKCAGKNKTTNDFIKEMKNINPNISILGKYVNATTKILCKCLIDGYEWYATPNNLLRGIGCPKCSGQIKYTHNQYLSLIYEKYKDNIMILSNFNGMSKEIYYKCNKCNTIHIAKQAKSLLRVNYPCNNCVSKERGLKLRLSQKEFKNKLYEKNKNIKIIDKYVKSNIKIKFYCEECKNYFYIEPGTLLYNDGKCPICGASKGEKKIIKYLQDNKINFLREYFFNDLRGDKNKPLRFDFAVLNTLNEVVCLVEFDGEFHFKKMYEDHDLEKQKRYDKMKDDYCKEHNIKLLRIPYWEFDNIEDILDLYLKENINKAS